jgi:hypothetical protein
VNLACRLTVGRTATAAERTRARDYLADYEAAASEVSASSSGTPGPRPVAVAILAGAETGDAGTKKTPVESKKPAPPENPDEVVQGDEPVEEEPLPQVDPRTAAWASFCQALLGTAEFRYVP